MRVKNIFELAGGIMFAVIMLILALYTGYVALWLFSVFMWILLFASFIMMLVGVISLKFSQYAESYIIEKGSSTNILLKCNNKSIFIYPGVSLIYEGGKTDEITIFPGENIHALAFKPTLKGVYDLGVDKIYIKDFFGFFSFSVKVNMKEKVYVLPSIRNFRIADRSDSGEFVSKEVKVNKTEDKNIISDLREYKYGDTLNKINWKATAKFNDVIVNNYENKFCPKSFVFVGGLKGGDDKDIDIFDDFACEIALTIIDNIISESGHISVFYEGKENILDSDFVKASSEYGMYLTERSIEDTYNEDILYMEKLLLDTSTFSSVIFVLRNVHPEIYDLTRTLHSNNINADIFKISKVDNRSLKVSKVNGFDEE